MKLLLQHISRHIQLDPTEEAYFLSLIQLKTIRKKEFLLKQGEICKTENFLLSGCMRTFKLNEQGEEQVVQFGIEDWWVGDLYSFLTQTPASYSIDALEDTVVAQITKENLDKLYEQVPKFDRFFRLILQNAFIAQQDRIHQNLSLTAEERYEEFVRRYPQLEQRVAQKHIASYLGITPVFLSMLRRKRVNG
ncbi:MAG TPA: Crp/Fnr family transcriptional regulator [Fluviicola sp.]|nr:Crp/Fnr family transcriptional regulator [Fluviicola sp.]